MTRPLPSADDAARIARDVLGEPAISVTRFTTGAGNWVYDVATARGERVVVRMMRSRDECIGGVNWSGVLRPLGVPLPRMIAYHIPENDDGERSWMVLERLAGTDLGNVYAALSDAQKLAIADRVVAAQAAVRSLGRGRAYGFTDGVNPPPHARWSDVLDEHLAISRQRILDVAAVGVEVVDRVAARAARDDFEDVAAVPFLDDTTTRNVIVHDGVFQGIVDVDGLCYGDPLFVVALTRNSLLAHGHDTIYSDAWADRWRLDALQRQRLDLYTAMFAVNFLGEQGQQFNLDTRPAVDAAMVTRLTEIVDTMLARIA